MLGIVKSLARRRKVILILILVASALLFLETRIDTIFHNIRSILESKIANVTNCSAKIQDIDGGFIRPLILNGVTLSPQDNNAFFDSIFAKRMVLDARFVDLIFKKNFLLNRIYIQEADLCLKKRQQAKEGADASFFKLPHDVSIYLKNSRILISQNKYLDYKFKYESEIGKRRDYF